MSTVETDPPKAQRHLAAILATDVVRSSWHMERKEAETILRLRDLRQNLIEPKVAEHRGRVFKTMGDGFLAEFVSALDAVHCAVDIQRLMAERNLDLAKDDRLELRIGINLGDVFREGDDVFGDGVNVAARLEASAPPGGIRVSRSVCDPIRDRFTFDFDDLGEHQFHNITRPIHVFGVLVADPSAEPPSPPPAPQPPRSATAIHVRRWPVAAAGGLATVAALVWFLLAFPFSGSAIHEGGLAFERKDYVAAAKWYRKAADQGNAAGEAKLGDLYQMGWGVAKDYAEAAKWYRKAADQGNAAGQVGIGYLYESGSGVARDYAEAAKWFRKAADQGTQPAKPILATSMKTVGELPRTMPRPRSGFARRLNRATAPPQPYSAFYMRKAWVSLKTWPRPTSGFASLAGNSHPCGIRLRMTPRALTSNSPRTAPSPPARDSRF